MSELCFFSCWLSFFLGAGFMAWLDHEEEDTHQVLPGTHDPQHGPGNVCSYCYDYNAEFCMDEKGNIKPGWELVYEKPVEEVNENKQRQSKSKDLAAKRRKPAKKKVQSSRRRRGKQTDGIKRGGRNAKPRSAKKNRR